MPLDVLGCTRATLVQTIGGHPSLKRQGDPTKRYRDGDRFLEFSIFNEEFLVSTSHYLALIASLPFVHTARRSYRLSYPVNNLDICDALAFELRCHKACKPYYLEEGEVVTRFP